MPRKLTPSITRQIRKLADGGCSTREIAAKIGLSRGTVANALAGARTNGKTPAPSKPAAAPPPPEPEAEVMDGAPPTLDEQLRWLGQTVLARHRDAQRLRAAGDDLGAARATRDMLAAQALLAKNTPTGEQTGVFVTSETIAQAAATGCAKLLERVRRHASKNGGHAKCRACKSPLVCATCGHVPGTEAP